MTTKDEALKLALEALERLDGWIALRYGSGLTPQEKEVITALREALNAPLAEQKSGIKQVIELYDSPEQPAPATELREQEPVTFLDWYDNAHWGNEDFKAGCWRAWNAALAQRKPLTDEQIMDIAMNKPFDSCIGFARAIEAAHSITDATQLKENT